MSDLPPLSRNLARSELEAVFETMFLAAFADDDFSDEERQRFAERVSELSGGDVTGEAFDELLALVTRELFTHGLEKRLASLAGRLPQKPHRELALQAAAQVASGDRLTRSELDLLDRLGQLFELDDAALTRALKHANPRE